MENESLLAILLVLAEKCSFAADQGRKAIGLSASEYRGLLCLLPGEKMSCRELSSRMDLSLSRCSRVIERLYQRGYIERADSILDRRCKNVWLTGKGVQARQGIMAHRLSCEKRLLTGIPEKRLDQLKSELKRLAAKF